jgi:hypothetical protein
MILLLSIMLGIILRLKIRTNKILEMAKFQ